MAVWSLLYQACALSSLSQASSVPHGVHKNVIGKAVSAEARRLAHEFVGNHKTSAWVNSNGTFGGQNSFDYVGVVPGVADMIPTINMQDAGQGLRNTLSCCETAMKRRAYPAAASVGAAWSPDFAYHHGKFGSQDWVEIHANSALVPGTAVHRVPTFGRSWEYLSGEDATIGSLSGDLVKGFQSSNILVAVKHFALNHQEFNRGQNILTGNYAIIDEEVLMENYLRVYQHVIDVGASGFMCSYNQIQFLRGGVTDGSHSYTCGSEALMSLLRESMGYGGLVMTDWGAQILNYTADGKNHSGRKFVDIEMNWFEDHSGIRLPFEEEGDASLPVERAIGGLYLSGLMKSRKGKAPTAAPAREPTLPKAYVASMANDVDAFETQLVAESLTLLKNEHVLPISKTKQSILLMGEAMLSGGGSGDSPAFSYLFPDYKAEGISNNGGLYAQRLMQSELSKALGAIVTWDFDVNTAGKVDYASFDYIIVFGSQYRSEAFRAAEKDGYYQIGRCNSSVNVSQVATDSGNQNDYYGDCDYPAMIKELAEARRNNTKVLSITSTGGVFAAFDFIDNVDVAITTYYPGQYFAAGLAAVLSGEISPGGKLTQTLPRLETLNGEQYIQSPIGRFNVGLKYPSSDDFCVKGSTTDCLRGAMSTLHAPAYLWDAAKGNFSEIVQYGKTSSNYSEGALVGYKYYEKYGMKPLFPFGFGLSYGKWSMSADFRKCSSADACNVAVDVKLGKYPLGKIVSNVVQLYLGYKPSEKRGDSKYAVKELHSFRKVWSKARVPFAGIDFNTAWDHVNKFWTTPCRRDGTPGVFTISVGFSSSEIISSHEVPCESDPESETIVV